MLKTKLSEVVSTIKYLKLIDLFNALSILRMNLTEIGKGFVVSTTLRQWQNACIINLLAELIMRNVHFGVSRSHRNSFYEKILQLFLRSEQNSLINNERQTA